MFLEEGTSEITRHPEKWPSQSLCSHAPAPPTVRMPPTVRSQSFVVGSVGAREPWEAGCCLLVFTWPSHSSRGAPLPIDSHPDWPSHESAVPSLTP